MKDKYFIDTNIFVYSFDNREPDKQEISRRIIRNALKDHYGCISSQVIQEFLNVALKKFARPLSVKDGVGYMKSVLVPLCEIYTSSDLYSKTLEVYERWKFSFYDSMIIAAALRTSCSVLYSEDLQHGQEIQSLTIYNPFI